VKATADELATNALDNDDAVPLSKRSNARKSKAKNGKPRNETGATKSTSPTSERPERATERPVARGIEARSHTENEGARRASVLPWLLAAGVLGGLLWYSQRPEPQAERVQEPAIAANLPEAQPQPKAEPGTAKPSAIRTIDLDAEAEGEVNPDAQQHADGKAAVDNTGGPSAQGASVHAAPGAKENPLQAQIEAPETSESGAAADVDAKANESKVEESGKTKVDAEPQADDATTDKAPGAEAQALPPFDAAAAKQALGTSALQASSCRRGDDPTGTAEVIITFAPSGRVTSANVTGAPYGGTPTGGCIASTLRRAQVPAFSGKHVTVRKLVKVR
jgi:hypothetical protein